MRTLVFLTALSFLLVLSRTQGDRTDTSTLLIKSQISKKQAHRRHPLPQISHSKLQPKRSSTLRSADVLAVQVRVGLTRDVCSPDQDCVGSRECMVSEGEERFPCSNESDICLCIPEEGTRACKYSFECVEGELCASMDKGSPICLSKTWVAAQPTTVQTDGLTWDGCEASSQCIAPRICRIFLDDEEEFKECNYNHDERCHCFGADGLTACETDADCPDSGEICAERTDMELDSFLCVSEDGVRRLSFWRSVSSTNPPIATPEPGTGPTSSPSATPTVQESQNCTYSYECTEGEVCASTDRQDPLCRSETFVGEDTATVQTDGLTWDDCEASSQCIAPRTCEIDLGNNEFKECNYNHDERCHCFAERFTVCETDADCLDRGEICAERTDKELDSFLCVSEDSVRRLSFWEAAPIDTESTSAPPTSATGSPLPKPTVALPPQSDCIDVRALSHLSEEDLVFKTHFVAPVLCDSNDSCATPAHVVMYEGKPMMMRSYCAIVGCRKENMYVNSPKYYRRLVVKSKTSGLHFTVFAARYGTRLEELVISSVLRLGF